MIHLDTSFLIKALAPGTPQESRLLAWLAGPDPVAVSAVAWAEFLCGPVSREAATVARSLLGEPVGLGAAQAERAALLFDDAGRRRGSFVDCLVAATALEAGARLATDNAGDFARFVPAGLHLVR
jgi:predicted nucleic acid-binding protein